MAGDKVQREIKGMLMMLVFSPRPMLWAMLLVQISAALGCQATKQPSNSDVACSDNAFLHKRL